MKRLALMLGLVIGCGQVNEPNPPIEFALTTIDNQPLPRAPIGWPAPIEAAGLDFGAITGLRDGTQGIVAQDGSEPFGGVTVTADVTEFTQLAAGASRKSG